MKKTNGKEAPLIIKVSGPFILPRRFTIEQLAQHLGITNFEAEERLRNGDINFKWAGSKGKGHKVVEKADADAWANLQPCAEVEANGSPEPIMSNNEIRPFFKSTHHKGNSIEIEIEAEKWKQLGKKTGEVLSRGDLEGATSSTGETGWTENPGLTSRNQSADAAHRRNGNDPRERISIERYVPDRTRLSRRESRHDFSSPTSDGLRQFLG